MGMPASDNLFDVMDVWSAPWLPGCRRGARRAARIDPARILRNE